MKWSDAAASVLLLPLAWALSLSGTYQQTVSLAATQYTNDVIPPLASQSPRLHFHLGGVQDYKPAISPTLPAMPFPPSPWYVAQWQQTSLLHPSSMEKVDDLPEDTQLGKASYGFASPDGHASLRIFRHEKNWVYELAEGGGI